MKECNHCHVFKTLSEFGKHKSHKDGLQRACNECRRADHKRYYENNAEQVLSRTSDRRLAKAVSEGKQIYSTLRRGISEDKQDWRYWKDPHVRARRRVQGLVHKGLIPSASKLPCHKCGGEASQYHHYNGYEPPHDVDVLPICHACHLEEHKK